MNNESIIALKNLAIRVDALRRAMESVINGTTPDHAKWGAYKSYTRTYCAFANQYMQITDDKFVNIYKTENMRSSSDTLWPIQKEIFDMVYADVLILSGLLSKYEKGESASISEVQDLLSANLRKVIFSRPAKETDVQNAIETLLIGRGYQRSIHYDRETGKFKFSGKEFIPDFIFPDFRLALEVKIIRERGHISKCVDEMSADIPAYLSFYKNILFCVYDLGEIRDVSEFESGIQAQPGVRICTIKH